MNGRGQSSTSAQGRAHGNRTGALRPHRRNGKSPALYLTTAARPPLGTCPSACWAQAPAHTCLHGRWVTNDDCPRDGPRVLQTRAPPMYLSTSRKGTAEVNGVQCDRFDFASHFGTPDSFYGTPTAPCRNNLTMTPPATSNRIDYLGFVPGAPPAAAFDAPAWLRTLKCKRIPGSTAGVAEVQQPQGLQQW